MFRTASTKSAGRSWLSMSLRKVTLASAPETTRVARISVPSVERHPGSLAVLHQDPRDLARWFGFPRRFSLAAEAMALEMPPMPPRT